MRRERPKHWNPGNGGSTISILVLKTNKNQHTNKTPKTTTQEQQNPKDISKTQTAPQNNSGETTYSPTSPLPGSRRAVPATALTIHGHRRWWAQYWPAERPSGLLAPCEPTLWPELSMGWSTTNWAGDWKYTESEYYEWHHIFKVIAINTTT